MENTSYALIVAGSTLVACMVIAVAVYVFNNLSIFQNAQDTVIERESIDEFNKAFEAYDKSLMYGADVLSCLNLAENNNQKYVYEVYQGDDNNEISYEARDHLLVNVYVTIDSPLTEKIEIYSRDSSGKTTQLTSSDREFKFDKASNNKTISSLFSTTGDGLFKIPNVEYYYFNDSNSSHGSTVEKNTDDYSKIVGGVTTETSLNVYTKVTNISDGKYSLVCYENKKKEYSNTAKLIALLSTATEIEQTVYNDGYDNTNKEPYGWLYATWTSAVSDFKTRKFVCTDLTYNPDTGYVDSLSFEEYKETK